MQKGRKRVGRKRYRYSERREKYSRKRKADENL